MAQAVARHVRNCALGGGVPLIAAFLLLASPHLAVIESAEPEAAPSG
jgi:hypothetical protein